MNIKFRVNNRNHSYKIQKLLFKLGYGWGPTNASDHTTVQLQDATSLFTKESNKCITYSIDKTDEYFVEQTTRDEVLLVHPNQLKFIKKLTREGFIYETNLLKNIIKNGFYYKKNTTYLNNLLKYHSNINFKK